MANSILTIDMITRKALEILENNLVITRNVNRQYDDSFAVDADDQLLRRIAVGQQRLKGCTGDAGIADGSV